MRTNITLMVATATLVGTVANPVLAAEMIERNHFKGHSASVVFNSSVPITCPDLSSGTLDMVIGLNGQEVVTHSQATPNDQSNVLSATVFRSDSCTGGLEVLFGSVENGYSFQSLQGASLAGEVTLLDGFGAPAGTLVVDVELDASGPVDTERTITHFEFETPEGPVTLFQRFAGRSCTGSATGTLVLDGTTLVGNLVDIFLLDAKAGSTGILH
jgi:hypothetical protein